MRIVFWGTPDFAVPSLGALLGEGHDIVGVVSQPDRPAGRGRKIRVVSMPSTNVFDAQDEAYRESVLPSSVKARVAVEAGVTDGWIKYVGLEGRVIGINSFGESAPAGDLFKHFGFTAENVVKAVEAVL